MNREIVGRLNGGKGGEETIRVRGRVRVRVRGRIGWRRTSGDAGPYLEAETQTGSGSGKGRCRGLGKRCALAD